MRPEKAPKRAEVLPRRARKVPEGTVYTGCVKQPVCLPKRALTKSQAAITLGVSEPTVVKLVREKRLRAFWVTETSLRFLPEDLDRFIAENATIPAKEAYVVMH